MDRLSSLWSTVNSCSRMVFREYWCPHTIHHLMVWQKGSSRLSSMLWSLLWLILPDPACTPQQQITRFLLSYRSTPHATTGSSPAKLFLGRDLRTCLSLTRPDLASCVACQQGKMKSNHDKHAKFQDVAVGDIVLARDHLSSRKWQSGTVVQQTAPHSYSVQQQDGQTWRRHLDDILLNSSSSGTTKAEEAPTEGDLQDYPGEANSSTPEDCGPEDPPPTATPASPELRRSKRTPKPHQRLIEEL